MARDTTPDKSTPEKAGLNKNEPRANEPHNKSAADKTGYDVLIVGAGVIGLSLAWELAQQDAQVCVIDRGPLGKEASWAGAGMIPPGPSTAHWEQATPFEQLEGLSQCLQKEWHSKLLELTGIDTDYYRSEALYFAAPDFNSKANSEANSNSDSTAFDKKIEHWQQLGITCNPIDAATLADIEPIMAGQATQFARAYHIPAEAQTRNPRHLRALIAACELAGVTLRPNLNVQKFVTSQSRIQSVLTADGPIAADQFCLATGSWSGELAASLGLDLPVRPVRGQVLLLAGQPGLLKRIINVGPRYLVPRRDGRILVGSTQEEVGFIKANTPAGETELLAFAATISPEIAQLPIEARWSGFRPGTIDDLPYLGQAFSQEDGLQQKNVWLATGHFRAGLQLSPATAVVMRELILGQTPTVDISTLGVDR